jgi:hypothetical protein
MAPESRKTTSTSINGNGGEAEREVVEIKGLSYVVFHARLLPVDQKCLIV